jgi:hypothetical protein
MSLERDEQHKRLCVERFEATFGNKKQQREQQQSVYVLAAIDECSGGREVLQAAFLSRQSIHIHSAD